MPVKFCSIASGSSGNCIFASNGNTNILIDAGLSGKRIEAGLNTLGISADKLDALFITHEHSDHTSGAGVISRRYDIPIYATTGTWKGLDKQSSIGNLTNKNKRTVFPSEMIPINDILVKPFSIPHDSNEPVAYSLFTEGKKIVIATDIGHETDEINENIKDADILLIESNHDVDMVKYGNYPLHLKHRILGQNGHLSNVSCGNLLRDSISAKLKHVFLGHLSDENNTPVLAYETVLNILLACGISANDSFLLHLAGRGGMSKAVVLD